MVQPAIIAQAVSQLYRHAKAERIAMTKLANKIIEEALGNKKRINRPRVAENQHIKEPN
jgi:hypothetical protein